MDNILSYHNHSITSLSQTPNSPCFCTNFNNELLAYDIQNSNVSFNSLSKVNWFDLDAKSFWSNESVSKPPVQKSTEKEIVKYCGKMELENLAYRLFGSCTSCNTLDNYANNCKTEPTNNLTCKKKQNTCQPLSVKSQLHAYKLDTHLIGPNSLFLNQFHNQINVQSVVQKNFKDICTRLSGKVFLGGVPIVKNKVSLKTVMQLQCALSVFGKMTLVWPKGITVENNDCGLYNAEVKRGHCYVIFSNPLSVMLLLTHCERRAKGTYIDLSVICSNVSLNSIHVIPWDSQESHYESPMKIMSDYNGLNSCTSEINTEQNKDRMQKKNVYSIFVGALHGMITARALYNICNDLFGNVYYATLDTDRYNYPIGSGRVTFSSFESYVHAINTNFINVQSNFFTKIIQIDPYIEDALCSKCLSNNGIYFCRNWNCFNYYCPSCWIRFHNKHKSHKPLRRKKSV